MNIHVLTFNPFQENTYIIYDEQTKAAAIIDAGCMFEKEQQQLENFIETNGLKVTYLLNTHLHLDHQFGNHFVASKYGVLPLASKEDEPLVNSLACQDLRWKANNWEGIWRMVKFSHSVEQFAML